MLLSVSYNSTPASLVTLRIDKRHFITGQYNPRLYFSQPLSQYDERNRLALCGYAGQADWVLYRTMKLIALSKEKIYTGNLVLVNAHYPLRNTTANSLAPADPRFPNILIQRDAANVLQLILDKISAKNDIIPVSGYRSAAEQRSIFDSSLKENGKEFTMKYVALPGHSEHQTGLAIDLGLNQANIDFIRPDFPYEGICDEFRKTAPYYGFIERYARGKEEITGISHEPWHFRYVGYPHSKITEENGFSLEEYIAFIKSFREHNKFVYHGKDSTVTEVYYVPAAVEKTEIFLPDRSVYQISGNNTDGFIVTVWRKQ